MVLQEIRRKYGEMTDAERRVADYVLACPQQVVKMSMAELSSKSATSDATVMRMMRRIGQSGFYQLKINLAIETSNDDMAPGASDASAPSDIVDYVERLSSSLRSIPQSISMTQMNDCVDLLVGAGTVYAFGWGNSNTIAQDLAHRLARMGVASFSSENIEYIMRSIVIAREGDVLVVVSHSGQAMYAIECMKLAHERGMKVILITNDRGSVAETNADLVLCCGISDEILGDWGHTSHVAELTVCDLICYFLDAKAPNVEIGRKSEGILAQFKL